MILNSNVLLAAGDYVKGAIVTNVSQLGVTEAPVGAEYLNTPELWNFCEFSGGATIIGFELLLGEAKEIDLLAFIRHSFPVGTKVTFRFYQGKFGLEVLIGSNTFTVGFRDPAKSQNWGEFSWGNQAPENDDFYNNSYFVLPQTVVASAIEVSIDLSTLAQPKSFYDWFNSSNFASSSPYILSRVWASKGFQPSMNVAYGAEVTYADERSSQKSKAGSKFFETQKVRRRLMSLTFELLPKNELMSSLLGPFHMRSGKSEEVIAILEPTKEETFFYSAVYGYISEPDKASYAWWEHMSTTLFIEEAL